jgi:hypothetical protein
MEEAVILHHFTTEWLETTNTPFELITCRKIDRFNLTIQGWVYLEDSRIVRPGDECRIVARRDRLLLRMRGVVVTVDRREFEPDDPELGSPEDVRWLLVAHNWQVTTRTSTCSGCTFGCSRSSLVGGVSEAAKARTARARRCPSATGHAHRHATAA